jgi:predicted MFS family arabinose efflux permease
VMVGWRSAFLIVGGPGILLGLLLLLTLPEPARGTFDEASSGAAKGETLRSALGGLLGDPCTRLLVLISGFTGLTTYALYTWAPAFLIRQHGMTTVSVGTAIAVTMVVGLMLGAPLAGLLNDHLCKSDMRWGPRLAAIGAAAMPPFLILFVTAPGPGVAIAALFGFNAASSIVQPALFATLLTTTAPERRAMAIFLATLCTNLIGAACGPLLVGSISDLLASAYGTGALGIGIAASGLGSLIGMSISLRASGLMRQPPVATGMRA